MTQYYSRSDTAYSGSAIFSIPFSYIDKDDISVYIIRDEVELEAGFTWLNNSQITVTDELETDDIVSIRRNTPIDEKIVTYQNMSMVLDKDNLNLSQDQLLNVVQEMYDNNVTFEIKIESDVVDVAEDVATANENANEAKSVANEALEKANNAVSTANSAEDKADNAVSTANNASTTAGTANNNAATAVNTANTAKNTADNAKNKVDTLETNINTVIEAASKINQLEQAVQTATNAASTATNKATEATNAANRAEAVIPIQTGQNGKFLQTNGSSTQWAEVDLTTKQDTLVSGTNIKTINNNSILGSGNLTLDGLPSQTGQSGKFLTTDGTDASWSEIDTGANKDLQNLTDLGNARLRYASFSINSGTVTNGENATLYLPTSPTVIELPWTQPTLSANGTMGGDSFAASASTEQSGKQAYHALDGSTTYTNSWASNYVSTDTWIAFYNPVPIKVTNLGIKNFNASDPNYRYCTSAGRVQISDDGTTWTDIKSYTNSTTGNSGATWSIDLSDNTNFSKYYRIYSDTNASSYGWIITELTITATYQETIQTGSTIVCNPCTITTADGKTLEDVNSTTYDVTNEADGNYFIFKDYSDGSLSLVKDFVISKTVPININLVGTLTINDGVISGFSATKYCKINTFNPSSYTWEINTKITTNDDFSTAQTVFGSTTTNYTPIACMVYSTGKFRLYKCNSSNIQIFNEYGTHDVQTNTTYWLRIKFTGSAYTLEYSLDGETYINDITAVDDTAIRNDCNLSFGVKATGDATTITSFFLGSIDFTQTNIKVNDVLYWNGVHLNWLDISTIPANFKVYENGSYTTNYDLVYIGHVKIESGAITGIKNVAFNAVRQGEWVANQLRLTTAYKNFPTSVSDDYSLADYLPDDGYNYEVLFEGMVHTGTSTGNYATLYLGTDIFSVSNMGVCGAMTRTNNYNSAASSLVLPVGAGRAVRVLASSNNTGQYQLYAQGYRRMGLNI